jgi:hypothetical protein
MMPSDNGTFLGSAWMCGGTGDEVFSGYAMTAFNHRWTQIGNREGGCGLWTQGICAICDICGSLWVIPKTGLTTRVTDGHR